tara:strand:+ start:353 stop:472 length:120 start_codon:yes stop_codon:yes gene_type:complete
MPITHFGGFMGIDVQILFALGWSSLQDSRENSLKQTVPN